MGRRRTPESNRSAYEPRLVEAYGDLGAPSLGFVREAVDREPAGAVLRELSQRWAVEDDTEINYEVCHTYVLRGSRTVVVKLSFVGPYAVVVSLAPGETGRGELVLAGPPAGSMEAEVVSVVTAHGFSLVPANHLETSVRVALVEGCDAVTLYAALFEPEGDLPWKRHG